MNYKVKGDVFMSYNDQLFSVKTEGLFPRDCIEEWMNYEEEFNFKKGDIIPELGKFKDKIYLIKKGSVSVFHIHVDGKECIVGLLSSGDFINLLGIFAQKESSMVFKALTEVTVVAIKKEKIKKKIEDTPTLAINLLSYFSCEFQEIVETLAQIAYGKVEERLIFLFNKLAFNKDIEDGWCPISCSLTHQDIAGMVGSTRETVTLLINKLIQTGIIRQDKDRIWVKLGKLN